jgi:nitrate/nitrite transport system permease protein
MSAMSAPAITIQSASTGARREPAAPKARSGPRGVSRLLGLLGPLAVPACSLIVFLLLWSGVAASIRTSLGTIPGPLAVAEEFAGLVQAHVEERAKAAAFHQRQEERNARRLAEDPDSVVKVHPWTGRPTFFDQILTSLQTVFAGFLLAALLGVPIGLLCGTSPMVHAALNPLIQIFKPVSPLAWLPIVTLTVSALYTAADGPVSKSFLNSAITVTLCSIWPAIINTALGVARVDRDLLNVARVLRLGWTTRVWRIVIPSALPFIFTGLRLSLGVGWMVLIAAEMLAQNPGLGKFVWDEFQNGSSESLSRIMVAVLVIGVIGFALDRTMLSVERAVTHGHGR